MAERGVREAFRYVVGGSDLSVDVSCDPCNFEGTLLEGIAFCTQCQEYLCTDCLRVHKKSRASRRHTILDGNDLPKSRTHSSSEDDPVLCEVHQQTITQFCVVHNVPLCDLCFSVDHRNCKGISDIYKVIKKEGVPAQMETFLAYIKSLTDRFHDLENRQGAENENIARQKEKCYDQIKIVRQEINSLLDDLEKKMSIDVGLAIDKEIKLASHRMTIIENGLKVLRIASDSAEKAKTLSDIRVYLDLNKLRPSVEHTENLLKDTEKNMYNINISFEADSVLRGLLTECKQFGKVTVQRSAAKLCSPSSRSTIEDNKNADYVDDGKTHTKKVVRNTTFGTDKERRTTTDQLPFSSEEADNLIPTLMKYTQLQKTKRYKLKVNGEDSACVVTGIHVLDTGDTLMCDRQNKTVKLLNTSGQITSSLRMESGPWDVAGIGKGESAVTLPDKKKIEIVRIEGRLVKHQKIRSMTTERKCWGLAYHRDSLYVSCHDNPGNNEVIILDNKGQLIRKILGPDSLQYPDYIAVDREGRIYLSDVGTHTLTCMTLSGKIVYTRTKADTGLNGPRGLLVDSDQNVYCVGYLSHNLQIVSADGNIYRTLVKKEEGMDHPSCLSYRGRDKALIVGMMGDNLQLYKFA